ncbi:Heat Labile Enterotoxin Type Iib [Ophiocordyceps camponoti-floridani]|uniref:Heat Labile Enterotoxin Type Iib n=1 Tax=Ophiocordyceps camponoti-floridani TaxID=2030778 RepID=A0A8H4Q1W7_9HYPO|nr:Heat Labile Enterotoxin Type Iib [Ophiocordyceps camponoti-floridani]
MSTWHERGRCNSQSTSLPTLGLSPGGYPRAGRLESARLFQNFNIRFGNRFGPRVSSAAKSGLRVLSKTTTLVAIPLYILDVKTTLEASDSVLSDKVEALTSIIPVARCATSAISEKIKTGDVSVVDKSLCLFADGLILAGGSVPVLAPLFWPLAFVAEASRWGLGYWRERQAASEVKEIAQEARDKSLDTLLAERKAAWAVIESNFTQAISSSEFLTDLSMSWMVQVSAMTFSVSKTSEQFLKEAYIVDESVSNRTQEEQMRIQVFGDNIKSLHEIACANMTEKLAEFQDNSEKLVIHQLQNLLASFNHHFVDEYEQLIRSGDPDAQSLNMANQKVKELRNRKQSVDESRVQEHFRKVFAEAREKPSESLENFFIHDEEECVELMNENLGQVLAYEDLDNLDVDDDVFIDCNYPTPEQRTLIKAGKLACQHGEDEYLYWTESNKRRLITVCNVQEGREDDCETRRNSNDDDEFQLAIREAGLVKGQYVKRCPDEEPSNDTKRWMLEGLVACEKRGVSTSYYKWDKASLKFCTKRATHSTPHCIDLDEDAGKRARASGLWVDQGPGVEVYASA